MSYEWFKEKYETTKPIRGVTPEIRPIGQRYRKWETINRIDLGDGTYAYAAKLHDTRCVVYYPDGSFDLTTGGWCTPSTAKFLTQHTPHNLYCVKDRNTIWIGQRGEWGKNRLPVTPVLTRFKINEYGRVAYADDTHTIKVRRTDRAKTKEIHQKFKPFLDWVKTMLAMSDGWLMHETRKSVMPIEYRDWGDGIVDPTGGYAQRERSQTGKAIPQSMYLWAMGNAYFPDYELLEDYLFTLHEDDYLLTLCIIANKFTPRYSAHISNSNLRVAESFPRAKLNWPVHYYDIKLSFPRIKEMLYKLVRSKGDVSKIVEVKPGEKLLGRVAA